MVKKYRSTRTAKAPPPAKELNPKDAKLRANTWEDVADEEDAFHLAQDKVLLEDDGRRGGVDDDSEEEVLRLEHSSDEDDDNDEEGEDAGEESDEEYDEEGMTQDVRAVQDDSSSDEVAGDSDSEMEEGWGSKKDYYGGTTLETEEDAIEEEKEALRLQQKHLAEMDAAAFGFDEEDFATPSSQQLLTEKKVITEILPQELPEDPVEREKLLLARHPEFDPLRQEFLKLQEEHEVLSQSADAALAVGETVATSVALRKYRVLGAYLGTLSMYFAVLATGKDVREHPVMEGLVTCRDLWNRVASLKEVLGTGNGVPKDLVKIKKDKKPEAVPPRPTTAPPKESAKRKRPVDEPAPDAKRKRTTRELALEASFADLDALTTLKPTRKPTTYAVTTEVSDFGEASTLTEIDASQKAARKRGLKFYSSQIAAKAGKRSRAGRDAGGDADIPHKERRKERELRLQAEAQRKRDLAGQNADLGDSDPDDDDRRTARDINKSAAVADSDSENEYYDMLKHSGKDRKEAKKAVHDAKRELERAGNVVHEVAEVGEDGKRKITYQIEKNKGLSAAGRRKKKKGEARNNPRVKKKLKFAEAKKKLGSVKAVYKGPLQGNYGGEATGIKTNVVKSVKFK